MKTFLKIIAGLLLLLIIIVVGLNFYFTDERLKTAIMPYVDEALGRPVQVESISLSFFSTFPQPGVSIEKLNIPGDAEGDTLVSLDKILVGVKLFSLFGDEIEFSQIELAHPRFTYKVYKDSTSNIDFLLSDEESDTSASTGGMGFNIPYFRIVGGEFQYADETSATHLKIDDLDADISLRFTETIESDVNITIGALSATVDNTAYLTGLSVSISEKSIINMKEETAEITEGVFSIKGLDLNISGAIKKWGSEPEINLAFNSSADNFGELLKLVPEKYQSHVENLDTKGSLVIEGSVYGKIGGEQLPAFKASVAVKDGYLKNPKLEKPIQDIQLSVDFSNELLTVNAFNATAGPNHLSGSASLQQPLEESGKFQLDVSGDIDLSTINSYVNLQEFEIEKLGGHLNLKAKASGLRSTPEKAAFDANISLENGILKYAAVPKQVEQINILAVANQNVVNIKKLSLKAAANTFSVQGIINHPLDEPNRSIDLEADLKFDLASVKEFYPISEDTLIMKGMLTANARLKGKADQIEKSVQSGNINLSNGMIDYKKIEKPFHDITLQSVLQGNQLTIKTARFKTGENNLNVSGVVTDYLSDNRKINLKLAGHAELKEITDYYEMEGISSITGTADMNLQVAGQVNKPENLALTGNLTLKGLNAEGDSLSQSVKNVNAELQLSPTNATLKAFAMQLGSSDISLSGSLKNYMEFLKDEKQRKARPQLTGNFNSNYLNLDEFIDWDDTTKNEKVLINLPDLNTSISANIKKLTITGVEMTNLKAKASTTPTQIKLEEASINLFEGAAAGSFVWNVPQPDRTNITFSGSLTQLRAESFFKEYKVLGEKSKFHEYVSGAFSAKVNYSSELDAYLTPQITSAVMDGSFGMTKARIQGHPVQEKMADFMKTKELKNIALDKWESTFTLKNSVLDIRNLKLTSADIGMELNGTQHLVNGTLNYDAQVLLPARFKKGMASVITEQAVDALTQENGTIMVPLKVTGTQENPNVAPNNDIIKPIIDSYLKKKAGNALNKIFEGF